MNDDELTQQTWLDYHEAKSTLTMADIWQARPGPNDKEAYTKYYKPYLTERESKLMFLHLSCGLTFKEISKRMNIKTPTLRQLWKRAKVKALKNELYSKTT